jgi:phosphatidylserine/phosphatidylglycerophosphate/cardiolipin synthase-like enzyme
MSDDYPVTGKVADALFTLKIHRGEGMALLAMNWKVGTPPDNFVGFGIEYSEPGGTVFYALKNRLNFDGEAGSVSSSKRPPEYSTLVAPIQKFRWAHFPRNADLDGEFTYRVTPVFMSPSGDLSTGTAQTAQIVLASETYPGALNVAFTRGFISSQAFVDRYGGPEAIETLLPPDANSGLDFKPTHPDAVDAANWMGFEARRDILALLDRAIGDPTAQVGLVAFDFNLPEIFDRVVALGSRVRVIIDDSDDHHGGGAAEDTAEKRLVQDHQIAVKRQHMGDLQHNKTIVVDGQAVQQVICGSTNMSWRGVYVQSNNALTVTGTAAVKVFSAAFDTYWNAPDTFTTSASAEWQSLGLDAIDAQIAFSPHSTKNSVLKTIADDLRTAHSSIFYSLAFLSITPGLIRDALELQRARDDLFVSGISDKRVGVEVSSTSSNLQTTYVAALDKDAPKPFSNEPTGLAGRGGGTRMHHKFIVVDFDRPTARVYLGSYNMSKAADGKNGENLVLIRDPRVATSYMIEAVAIIDHYQFRVAQKDTKTRRTTLELQRPPSAADQRPWWAEDYSDPHKVKDRELFA